MKVYVSVGLVVVRGVGTGVGRGEVDEMDIGVGDEVGKVFELEVGCKVSSIKKSNMKSMCGLMTVYIEIMRVILVMKLVEVLIDRRTVMFILKLEAVISK